MKRASLSDSELSRPDEVATDLTDRLLSQAPIAATGAKPKAAPPKRRAALKPAAKKAPSRATASDDEPLPFIPYRPVPEKEPVERPGPRPSRAKVSPARPADPIGKALEQAAKAVRALAVATDSPAARYDLAVRYRLDALAHHVEQVAEFVRSATRE